MNIRERAQSFATMKMFPLLLLIAINQTSAVTIASEERVDKSLKSTVSIPPTTETNAAPPSEKLWTLNQQNADIREFIAQVAKIVGETFVVDPRIKSGNSVTVISSKPLTRDEVYDVFFEVLSANGYTVIPKGRIMNVVPNTTAKTNSPNDQGRPVNGVMTTKVIELHSVSSVEVIPIIRPLIAQFGHAAASASSNAVIVSDLAGNVERITKLVKELDDAGNNDYEVIQLKHAWVGDVSKIISDTLVTGKGHLPSGLQVIADERSNRLVIKGNASKRSRVRKLVSTLDKEGIRKSTTKVMFLRYADAVNMADILAEASGSLQESQGKTGSNGGGSMSPPSSAALSQGKSPSTKSGGQSRSAVTNIFVKADESQNALIMIADPETLQEMERIVRQLDVPRAQVLLEAVIVEVSGGIDDALGIQWGIDGTNTIRDGSGSGSTTATSGLRSRLTGNILNNSDIALGSLALRTKNFGVLVTAISAKSNNNILSTPSMLTLDNQEAEFLVGKNIPIKTGSEQKASGNAFTTTDRKDVGIKLKITPHINEGNSLRLELEQEISSLDQDSAKIVKDDLVFSNRTLKTTVLIDDGQTVVIGGLLEDNKRGTKSKIPFLGDIPLLGRLFSYEGDNNSKRNLMLFIRPTIMRSAENLVKATQDRFTKLKLMNSNSDEKYIMLPDNPDELFDKDTFDLRQSKSLKTN